MFPSIHPTKFVHIQNFDVPALYLNKSFFLEARKGADKRLGRHPRRAGKVAAENMEISLGIFLQLLGKFEDGTGGFFCGGYT